MHAEDNHVACAQQPASPHPPTHPHTHTHTHPHAPTRFPSLPPRSWQQARCVNEHNAPLERDIYGAQLAFSGKEADTMALGLLRLAYNAPAGGEKLPGPPSTHPLPLAHSFPCPLRATGRPRVLRALSVPSPSLPPCPALLCMLCRRLRVCGQHGAGGAAAARLAQLQPIHAAR
jgi:hypothetical protein